MTIIELGEILSGMYGNASDRNQVAMIHLFGIRYSSEIKKHNYSPKDIIKNTKLKNGLPLNESYQTEIHKGVKLAEYVIDKESLYDFIKKTGK
jgi:hypothetical protein